MTRARRRLVDACDLVIAHSNWTTPSVFYGNRWWGGLYAGGYFDPQVGGGIRGGVWVG